MSSGKYVSDRIKKLFSSSYYTNNKSLSEDVASLFIPRRSNIESKKTEGDTAGWYDHILEPAPIEAAQTLAQGQYDLLFTGNWFETIAPFMSTESNSKTVDPVAKAYAAVGGIMRDIIEASNFKLEIQEFLLDRSTVHTAAILVDADDEDVIFCRNLAPGSYSICENYKKEVDTLARKIPLTARQVKQQFYKSTDTIPDKIQKALEADRYDEEFEVCQLIEPRDDGELGSANPKKLPWASYYVYGKEMIRESGYHEKPFMVSRYNRWGDSPFGTGPAHIELPRARLLQKMRQALIALGDRITSPGIFVSEGQEGEVNPYGITVVSREDNASGLPREWQTAARYDVTVDMLDREIDQLNDVFMVPLFKLLMNDTERQKTAYEVQKMLEEQIGRASPTFARLDKEVIVDFLMRVFNICLRANRFQEQQPNLSVEGGIAQPSINFTSKLAQAMKAVRSNTVIQFLQSLGFLFEMKPEVLINTDWNKTYRRMWKESGNPIDELEDGKKVKAEQDMFAQAQMAQQSAETGKTAAEAQKATR
jgi:hypothetical protein